MANDAEQSNVREGQGPKVLPMRRACQMDLLAIRLVAGHTVRQVPPAGSDLGSLSGVGYESEIFTVERRKDMPRYGSGGARRSSGGQRGVRGYSLRGRNGRINYVGVTNNPGRRATEHKQSGKRGSMKVETRGMSREAAQRWEARRLDTYRRNHEGKNPPSNRTRGGGWRG